MSRWTRKDLIGLDELSAEELWNLLDTAAAFKGVGERSLKKVPALRGRTLVNFFVEPSTRTRTSFRAGCHALERGRREHIRQRVQPAARVKRSRIPRSISRRCGPTSSCCAMARPAPLAFWLRGSAPALSMRATVRTNIPRRVCSILSRFARSGAKSKDCRSRLSVIFSSAAWHVRTFTRLRNSARRSRSSVPPRWSRARLKSWACGSSTISTRSSRTADVINLLRIQHERQRKEYFPGLGEYIALFGLTKARAARLKPDCLIMHPGPINRGVEIDSDVADGREASFLNKSPMDSRCVWPFCTSAPAAWAWPNENRPHHQRQGHRSRQRTR